MGRSLDKLVNGQKVSDHDETPWGERGI